MNVLNIIYIVYIYCSTTSCPTQQLMNLCFSLKVKASSSVDQSCRKTAPQHIKSCSTKVWNGFGLRSKVSIPKCDPDFCHCSSFSAPQAGGGWAHWILEMSNAMGFQRINVNKKRKLTILHIHLPCVCGLFYDLHICDLHMHIISQQVANFLGHLKISIPGSRMVP